MGDESQWGGEADGGGWGDDDDGGQPGGQQWGRPGGKTAWEEDEDAVEEYEDYAEEEVEDLRLPGLGQSLSHKIPQSVPVPFKQLIIPLLLFLNLLHLL